MRSALSILAGYVVAIVLVVAFFGAYAAIYGAATIPGPAWMVASLAWGLCAAIAAGWVTARLAPSEPMRHAVGLIVLSITIGILFTWVFPQASPEAAGAEPLWLQTGNLLVVVLGVPIGARRVVRATS